MSGWIKVCRNLLDHWVWDDKPFTKGQAWMDILLLANYSDKKVLQNGDLVDIKRGSFITSELKLMERWGWSKNKVRAFLKLLESESMIVKESNRKRTMINVVNYSKYQVLETTKEPPKVLPTELQEVLPKVHNIRNNKELKNKKNINKYTCAFEALWDAYPRKKEKAKAYSCYQARLKDGFSEDELMLVVKRYADEVKCTDEKYIKLAATFLSSNKPFADYLGSGYKVPKSKKTSFSNFEGREYDMDDLERQLLE